MEEPTPTIAAAPDVAPPPPAPPAPPAAPTGLLFFDGHCNLCNSTVSMMLDYDKFFAPTDEPRIKFAPLQSDEARKALTSAELRPEDYCNPDNPKEETVVFFTPDMQVHIRSTAILRALAFLSPAWLAFFFIALLHIFPLGFRDAVYKQVAKNRLRLFGKSNTCRVPSKAERRHFLVSAKKKC